MDERMSSTMTTLYEATVTRIGASATDMIEAGVVILFGEPCPDALAEVSIVHRGGVADERLEPLPGDVLVLGAADLVIRAAGDLAGSNLRELGHIVLYCDPAEDQALLPGAIFVDGQVGPIAAGARIALERGR